MCSFFFDRECLKYCVEMDIGQSSDMAGSLLKVRYRLNVPLYKVLKSLNWDQWLAEVENSKLVWVV